MAMSATSSLKRSPRAAKSVSQFTSTRTPSLAPAWMYCAMAPSAAMRDTFFVDGGHALLAEPVRRLLDVAATSWAPSCSPSCQRPTAPRSSFTCLANAWRASPPPPQAASSSLGASSSLSAAFSAGALVCASTSAASPPRASPCPRRVVLDEAAHQNLLADARRRLLDVLLHRHQVSLMKGCFSAFSLTILSRRPWTIFSRMFSGLGLLSSLPLPPSPWPPWRGSASSGDVLNLRARGNLHGDVRRAPEAVAAPARKSSRSSPRDDAELRAGVDVLADRALRGDAGRLLIGEAMPFLQTASSPPGCAPILERLLAVHHAGAGLLAELLHLLGGDGAGRGCGRERGLLLRGGAGASSAERPPRRERPPANARGERGVGWGRGRV